MLCHGATKHSLQLLTQSHLIAHRVCWSLSRMFLSSMAVWEPDFCFDDSRTDIWLDCMYTIHVHIVPHCQVSVYFTSAWSYFLSHCCSRCFSFASLIYYVLLYMLWQRRCFYTPVTKSATMTVIYNDRDKVLLLVSLIYSSPHKHRGLLWHPDSRNPPSAPPPPS